MDTLIFLGKNLFVRVGPQYIQGDVALGAAMRAGSVNDLSV